MPTRAQKLFRESRKEDDSGFEDSRDFDVWYHNEDVKRIVWSLFQRIDPKGEAKRKKDYLDPYVFFDGLDQVSFDDLMALCKEKLIDSDKLYFPFIIKPEMGSAHYFAGIIRRTSKEDKKPTLFLFNPMGNSGEDGKNRFKNKLATASPHEVGGMKLVLSPHAVQTREKDGGNKLVSCGPLSVALIQYAIENPDWIDRLDETFDLPELLKECQHLNKEGYRERITTLRKAHDETLSGFKDFQLNDGVIDAYFESHLKYFLDGIHKKTSISDDEEDEFRFYNDSDDEEDFEVKEPIVKQNETKVNCQDKSPLVGSKPEVSRAINLEQPNPILFRPKGIEIIQNEILRLRSTSWFLWFFRNSALEKADKIQKALDHAIIKKVDDVRLDESVRNELSGHRIFSFFGCKKARALDNVDQSLEKDRLEADLSA